MKKPRIVIVGSNNTDLIVLAYRLPLPGETVLGGDLITTHGSKGANQAVAAARLGADVIFVACFGVDTNGQAALQNLSHEGLNISYVVRDDQAPSGVVLIIVGAEGQNIIAVAPGANARLRPQDIAAAVGAIASADVMLLQLETPMETVLAAAYAARRAGVKVILNPAPAPAQGLSRELIDAVDILTPNQTEATLLTGIYDPEQAATAILQQGMQTVIVTLGKDEALLATLSDGMERIESLQVPVVDTTAAGDAFNTGLAVGLGRGEALNSAVRYANAVAALCVTCLGAQPSLPTFEEVESFLQHY